MSQAADRRQHLFVVRTWRESSRVVPVDQWRGSVEHVSSGQRVYFTHISDLNQFLLTCMTADLEGEGSAPLQVMFDTTPMTPETHADRPLAGTQAPPVTLTAAQIACVHSSFRRIAPQVADIAQCFYQRLFTLAPALSASFPADTATRERQFVALLTTVINELSNPAKIRIQLHSLGRRHILYNAQPEIYALVGATILWAIAEHSGEEFTGEVEDAWFAAYRLLLQCMTQSSG